MAWYYRGRKYWYHNGKKHSKKMKYGTYKLERDRDAWLKFADESNSWFNSFYKKKKRDKVSEAIFNMASDPKFKDSINLEKARMDRKVREWENFTGESINNDIFWDKEESFGGYIDLDKEWAEEATELNKELREYEKNKWLDENWNNISLWNYKREDFKNMSIDEVRKKLYKEHKTIL